MSFYFKIKEHPLFGTLPLQVVGSEVDMEPLGQHGLEAQGVCEQMSVKLESMAWATGSGSGWPAA